MSTHIQTLSKSFKRDPVFYKLSRNKVQKRSVLNNIEFHSLGYVRKTTYKIFNMLFNVFISDPLFSMKDDTVYCSKGIKYINDWKDFKYKSLDTTGKSNPKNVRIYTSKGRLIGTAFLSILTKLNNISKKYLVYINNNLDIKSTVCIGLFISYPGIVNEFFQFIYCICIASGIKHIVMETKKLTKKFHDYVVKCGFSVLQTDKTTTLYGINLRDIKLKKNFVKIISGEKWRKEVENKYTEDEKNIKRGQWKKRVTWYTQDEKY